MSKKVVIVGGHGNVALRLARLISPTRSVTSIIRDPSHVSDVVETGATPHILSLEADPPLAFASVFEGADVVVFSAGAGGKGGEERTKLVDFDGAVKVFDAIEAVQGPKPRLILVSSIDVRDTNKPVPDHYDETDKMVSQRIRSAIPNYMKWKYEADKELSKRNKFQWFILRPGGLKNDPGTGKGDIGKTHLSERISRDDVAAVLALAIDRTDLNRLAFDLVGGETPLAQALDAAAKKGETAFFG